MSKWLTTGQMIDRLKVGEVAEGKELGKVKKFHNSIRYVDDNGDPQTDRGDLSFVSLVNNIVLREKWRILPNYVSFEEAKKALEEDKTVYLHYYQYNNPIKINGATTFNEIGRALPEGLWFSSFLEGDVCKWTIEDDNQ